MSQAPHRRDEAAAGEPAGPAAMSAAPLEREDRFWIGLVAAPAWKGIHDRSTAGLAWTVGSAGLKTGTFGCPVLFSDSLTPPCGGRPGCHEGARIPARG